MMKQDFDTADPRWQRLRELIVKHSYQTGDFKLSSGRTSTYLFQLRQTTMLPEGQYLLGHLIVEAMRWRGLTCLGGMEMGAVPIVTAAAFASHLLKYPVDAFFVRKEAKKHGAMERIDGHLPMGADVLIIDDVTTTGGSAIRAAECVREERAGTVRFALAVVDREEGAEEAFAAQGITLLALFRRRDFGAL